MPSTSKKQHNFMEAVAHSPSFAKKVGVPQSVGSDFSKADKGRKFAQGGDMATKRMFGGKESYPEEMREAVAVKSNRMSPSQYARGEMSEKPMGRAKKETYGEELKKGMAIKSGRVSPKQYAMAAPMKKGGMASGGYTKEADGVAQRGKTKATQPKMFSAGGYTSTADGVAKRGKTQATQIKMKRGGGC